jgi:hypothetical protein
MSARIIITHRSTHYWTHLSTQKHRFQILTYYRHSHSSVRDDSPTCSTAVVVYCLNFPPSPASFPWYHMNKRFRANFRACKHTITPSLQHSSFYHIMKSHSYERSNKYWSTTNPKFRFRLNPCSSRGTICNHIVKLILGLAQINLHRSCNVLVYITVCSSTLRSSARNT